MMVGIEDPTLSEGIYGTSQVHVIVHMTAEESGNHKVLDSPWRALPYPYGAPLIDPPGETINPAEPLKRREVSSQSYLVEAINQLKACPLCVAFIACPRGLQAGRRRYVNAVEEIPLRVSYTVFHDEPNNVSYSRSTTSTTQATGNAVGNKPGNT
ncbi:hypothetical protein SAY87_008030 [Trapa incisa]|uniref:Uncharacterized protein n=1 Tax=Trapa incisa TaxID=236973 RepID=A0AAN7KKH8_9MYRT|nr:hypothetical protein SAY87_008030 [Trapa incisa]